jgi:hypothetical protein
VSITIAPEHIPPDHVGAVIARLRQVTNLLALCPDEAIGSKTVRRIGGAFRPGGAAKHQIAVLDAGGLGGEMPLDRPRVSVYCYATEGHEATALARLVAAALVPLDRQETQFAAVGCLVTNVTKVTGYLPLPVATEGWHCRVTDYLLLVNQGVAA